ncbi:MAG: hypothetical protein LBM20_04020 [Rikenellaceae bacterium]|jgi:hypothetical protein|nr:hypothetical protein [Rikenellaceae bacterium]
MKKVSWALAIVGLLCGIIAYQHERLKRFRSENNTLNSNLFALLNTVDRYKTRDSLNAASVGALQLTLSQYRKWRQQDAETIESLNIRLKRVENVSRHALESNQQLTIPLQDTVILFRERADTGRAFAYRSPYIDLRGRVQKDSVDIQWTATDTLLQVVHRVPRRFLFFRYGTKAIRQEIVSKNPHTEITYTEYVEFRK